jgi:hypothetical protein
MQGTVSVGDQISFTELFRAWSCLMQAWVEGSFACQFEMCCLWQAGETALELEPRDRGGGSSLWRFSWTRFVTSDRLTGQCAFHISFLGCSSFYSFQFEGNTSFAGLVFLIRFWCTPVSMCSWFFLEVLGFELRASHLLGMWATPPALFAFPYFSSRISSLCPGLPGPLSSYFMLSAIAGLHHHTLLSSTETGASELFAKAGLELWSSHF